MTADAADNVQSTTTPRKRGRRRLVTWAVVLLAVAVAFCAVVSQVGLWRARVSLDGRNNKNAMRWLSVAGVCWPRSAEWHFLSAIGNRRVEDFDKVQLHLRRSHELGWPVNQLERQQLLALAQTGQFKEIQDQWSVLFQTAESDGPEICKAYVQFALSRFRLDEAAPVLDAWKQDFPSDPDPYMTEGDINFVLLRWKRAESSYRKALEIDSGNDRAHVELAKSLIKQLKFTEAVEHLQAVTPATAATPEVAAPLAHCLAQLGNIDAALLTLSAATKNHQANTLLNSELGRLQLMRGKNAEAIAALELVLKEMPENTEIRYAYAQALRNSGKKKEAQQHFKLVDKGTKALRQLSALTKTIQDDPGDVEARFRIAEVTWRWKSRKDGLAWLSSILELAPNHQSTHALLAEHYKATGDPQKAEYHSQMSHRKTGHTQTDEFQQ